ncbi:MAG: hypothetical protein JXA96_13735 [Sedimentisphaerales bacterium]|nr:hypothetical protein [Sedimentisphaerales bacterium]
MKSFSGNTRKYIIISKQITATFAMIVLAVSSLNAAQVNTNTPTFTISGNVGIAGVAMSGLPGNPVTDSSGRYSVEVPFGWAGNVSPVKDGYNFAPPKRIYSAVSSDFTNQDYSASVISFNISGQTGIPAVEMQGLPGNPVTRPDGSYTVTVDYGFTGTVKPVKEGFNFSPSRKDYSNIKNNYTNQDYKGTPIVCTISGTTGIGGVRMEGLPGNPVTVSDGSYNVVLSYGWNGIVTPKKEGYTFDPPEIEITNINSNLVQNFQANVKQFEISGNVGMPGVEMQGLPGNTYSNQNGSYRAIIEYGWSGTVKPVKSGFNFEPDSRIYNEVKENYTYDNYISEAEDYNISGTIVSDKGEPVEDVVLTSNGVNPVVTDSAGQYLFEVEYGWSGVIKPEHQSYTFSPALMRYSNVQRDMANQNYKAQIRMLTISDTITINDGKPLRSAQIKAIPGDISTITDSRGQYSIKVPYGWTGEFQITPPSQPGIIFEPVVQSFKNVTTDIINKIPVPPTNVLETTIQQSENIRASISKPVGRRILVVPSGEVDSKDVSQTKEDILVMAEILDERFREPRLIEGVLRDFGDFFGRDNKQTEAMCIQGYGIIFMMEVNCQFSSLSQPEEKVEIQTNSDTDQTWQQARQRILSPGTGNDGNSEYEVQMVNILKTELIRTLKYASNIRNIKPDEWVILSVSGVSRQSMPPVGMPFGGYGGGMMVGGTYGYGGGSYSGYGGNTIISGYDNNYGIMNNTITNSQNVSPAASVMTIRVKKSDVDEFANDKIDLEHFRQKVQILLY